MLLLMLRKPLAPPPPPLATLPLPLVVPLLLLATQLPLLAQWLLTPLARWPLTLPLLLAQWQPTQLLLVQPLPLQLMLLRPQLTPLPLQSTPLLHQLRLKKRSKSTAVKSIKKSPKGLFFLPQN